MATVDGVSLEVVIAQTSAEQSQGLAGIPDLPGGIDGMLFVYTEPRDRTFNMRTVEFPLDIWWFDGEGRLIGRSDMETCLDGGCLLYPSPGEIMWALETPSGAFDFEIGSLLESP